jgi:signal transduction histidine kinase
LHGSRPITPRTVWITCDGVKNYLCNVKCLTQSNLASILPLQLLFSAVKLRISPPFCSKWLRLLSTPNFGHELSVRRPTLSSGQRLRACARFVIIMIRGSIPATSRRLTSRGFSRLVWTAASFGIAILLAAVALLQYRWNMQIRQASELRAGADLESVLMKWHLNLYREFSTICIALQVGPDSGAHDPWNVYLRRYEEWRSAASNAGFIENIYSNPDVVSDIYIYETSRGENRRLLRFNPDADRIERSPEPRELQSLLAYLQGRSSNLRVALRAWQSEDSQRSERLESDTQSAAALKSRMNTITGWQFDESIPAIVHPLLHHGRSVSSDKSPVDWFVIVLDRDTIQRRIFPELAQRYFAGSEGLEYKLAVVAVGKESRVLYSSDPGFGIGDLGGSDSVMNIFGPPPESTEGSFWQVVKNRESLHGGEWHSFSAPVWFPVIHQASDSQHWVLFLEHRTGPMEASITKAWRGNLLVGGFVLLLLATSMFLVVIASHRARALACLQMDFVASISHELRTPLAAILSAGQNLSDGFAPDLYHYGGLITGQARQLIDLVDQILLFASMKDDKKKYHVTAVLLSDVIDSLRKTTLTLLGTAGFHVECRMDKGLPRVLADQQALVRCLQNLIDNAAKYSGESRWICVSAELDESNNGDAGVRVEVADRGVGIDPSELPHIFEPFYRSPGAIAAQIHGSGLGLSVVKHMITQMGGRLSVSSEVGRGSIFTLHLQVAEDSTLRSRIEGQEALTSR